MLVAETNIPCLKLINLKDFRDSRGGFRKVFNKEIFEKYHLATNFQESYYSISHKNVIRGMHFQVPPFEHAKLVYVNQGKILDVVLDLRKNSPTYGNHFSLELSADKPIVLYVPIGCAHGFLSLADGSMVTYLQTSVYSSEHDRGVKFDSFGMNWKCTDPIISPRDLAFQNYKQFKTPF